MRESDSLCRIFERFMRVLYQCCKILVRARDLKVANGPLQSSAPPTELSMAIGTICLFPLQFYIPVFSEVVEFM